MRNRSIQRGGAFIVVVDPTTGKRTIISNPIGNSRILFDKLISVESISVESHGSFVFVGEIPQPNEPGTLIQLRSQVRSVTKRPLTQDESLPRPRNIDSGESFTRVCMKVIFVGETPDRVVDRYTKEVVTLKMAEQEVQTQHQMYRKLISGGTGVNGAVIPDAIGSCLLECDDFKSLIPKSKQTPGSPVNTKHVLECILLTAETRDLKLYVSFIEYLEGFVPFNESDHRHKWNIPSIGGGAVAILLKTGCVSLDMYYKNIMINKHATAVQFIDFGKRVCFTSPEDLANVNTWFTEYSNDCDPDKLKLLDKCFTTTVASAKTVSRHEVQAKFNAYCHALPSRLEHWKTLTTTQEKVKEVFDLLTFIGFIDCLYGLSNNREDQSKSKFLMQFGLFMNLLLGIPMNKPFVIDDIISIRANIHTLDQWLSAQSVTCKERFPTMVTCKERFTTMVPLIDDMILPDETLGREQSPESFEYGSDSQHDSQDPEIPTGSSSKKHKGDPKGDPKGEPKGGRGRKPITKKRRRVKRKIRTSRRKR